MRHQLPVFVLLFCTWFAACSNETPPAAADTGSTGDAAFDGAAELASLDGSDDSQALLDLAARARVAGDYATAGAALDRAETTAVAPPRLSFERARLAVAMGQPEQAEAVLQAMIAGGFTAVQFVTGDPLLNSLAGRARYDGMVAELSVAAYPCEHQDGFRDFDFWLGEWIVHASNGQHVGNNVIRSVERGCVITENWTDTSGGTGMSINYLDKATNEWVQVWNAGSGSQINIRGGLTDEGMALEGTIHYVATGVTAPFRGLWTALEDGRVRQYFEQSSDGGETWQPWFEGFYTRTNDTE